MFLSRASRFCEQIHLTGIAQVANSWSSLAFLPAAWFLLSYSRKTERYIKNEPLFSYLYLVIFALIGFTSFYNHATLSFWGGVTDFESMFLLITFALLLGLRRFWNFSNQKFIIALILLNVPLTYVAGLQIADFVFAFLVIAAIGVELLAQFDHRVDGDKKYFWLALTMLLTGYGIWLLDVWKIWCNPTSLIQGHAVWHILAATAASLLYYYYLPPKTEF